MSSPVSAGDVIALSILIKDVIKALDDSSGSSTEYQEIVRELWSLDKALLEVEHLSRTYDTTAELNALSCAARRATEQCRLHISKFLDKIKSYNRSLGPGGSGNRLKDAARKVQWTFAQKDELVKFRTEINGHASAINMLLITASISYTRLTGRNFEGRLDKSDNNRDTSTKEILSILNEIQEKLVHNDAQLQEHGKQLNAQRQAGNRLLDNMHYFTTLSTDLKHFMTSILTATRHSYKVLLDVQSRVPREFKPCWIQEPVVLTDALGRVAPIHIELCNSWNVFDSVLAARFINLPGHDKVARKEVAFEDRLLGKDVDRSQPFVECFLPGRRIDMSMVFEQKIPCTSCPKCGMRGECVSERGNKCPGCGLWFQRVEEVIDDSTNCSSVEYGACGKMRNLYSENEASKKRKRRTSSGEDDIRPFQRVRLLLKFRQSDSHRPADTLKSRHKSQIVPLHLPETELLSAGWYGPSWMSESHEAEIRRVSPAWTYDENGFRYTEGSSQHHQNVQDSDGNPPYDDFYEPESVTHFPNPYTNSTFYDWLFRGKDTTNTDNALHSTLTQLTETSDPTDMSIQRQGYLDPWSIGDDYLSTLLASTDDSSEWTEYTHSTMS